MIWFIYLLVIPLAATLIATLALEVQDEDETDMQIAGVILAAGLAILWPAWLALSIVGLPAWLCVRRLRKTR